MKHFVVGVSPLLLHRVLCHPRAVSKYIPQGMGWIPDLPDPRDYSYRHDQVLPLLAQLKRSRRKQPPDEVDLSSDDEGEYFTPPEDQGPLNSSAAFAVLSLVEYFERRGRGRTFEGSKLFLYKVARNLRQKRLWVGTHGCLSRRESSATFAERKPTTRTTFKPPPELSHSMGDTGADLRTTLRAVAQFGVPSEEYWPYDVEHFDEEPSQFLYSLAKPPPGIRYLRLDEANRDGAATWETWKSFLAAGFPIAFGFSVPSSLTAAADIAYRPGLDSIRGGQAAVAIGYRNHHFGRHQHAVLIRCSWGTQWGDNGNGWLPITFVCDQIARDSWTLVSEAWLDSQEFSRPTVIN